MNKAIAKTMLALAICAMMATGAVAAPGRGAAKDRKAPSSMRAGTPERHVAKSGAKKGRIVKVSGSPKRKDRREARGGGRHGDRRDRRHREARGGGRHEVRREVIYVHDYDPPRHHRDNYDWYDCDDHHSHTLHSEDWCEIGFSLLGGLLGGIVGSAL
ncbi:MAG: hypothetical protein K6F50_10250 [Kiritimatiellae bacterium]|nr:hypothetical protein [Kiritimatiellia bacterium]